nr:ribonuclease HII [Candidatus Methylobacter favarea]
MNKGYSAGIFQNFNITGVDEAGRGPLAGPVVAAAVILNPMRPIEGLADSKILSEPKRNSLSIIIKETALSWSVAQATVEEIDELNILQATFLAMRRAINNLHVQPDEALIDGNCIPDLAVPARAIIRGDSKVKAISAASILAKVERDKIMCGYYKEYPDFSFHEHKGYGTKQHLAEIEQFGFSDIHRRTFNPVKSIIIQMEAK